jgi:hypothetical protein
VEMKAIAFEEMKRNEMRSKLTGLNDKIKKK